MIFFIIKFLNFTVYILYILFFVGVISLPTLTSPSFYGFFGYISFNIRLFSYAQLLRWYLVIYLSTTELLKYCRHHFFITQKHLEAYLGKYHSYNSRYIHYHILIVQTPFYFLQLTPVYIKINHLDYQHYYPAFKVWYIFTIMYHVLL